MQDLATIQIRILISHKKEYGENWRPFNGKDIKRLIEEAWDKLIFSPTYLGLIKQYGELRLVIDYPPPIRPVDRELYELYYGCIFDLDAYYEGKDSYLVAEVESLPPTVFAGGISKIIKKFAQVESLFQFPIQPINDEIGIELYLKMLVMLIRAANDKEFEMAMKLILEKAKIAYEQSKGTPTEEIAFATNQTIQKWKIGDQDQAHMTRNMEKLIFNIELKIPPIPENKYIYNIIKEFINEPNLPKKVGKLSDIILLIPTTIVEKGGILIKGDVAIFKNIKNAKIINKAIVIDSFNKVKKEQNEEVAGALLHIGEFIEKSGNVSAGILFDKFNEELNKPKPEKSTLRKIWDGIEKTLPTINTLTDVIIKLSPLF